MRNVRAKRAARSRQVIRPQNRQTLQEIAVKKAKLESVAMNGGVDEQRRVCEQAKVLQRGEDSPPLGHCELRRAGQPHQVCLPGGVAELRGKAGKFGGVEVGPPKPDTQRKVEFFLGDDLRVAEQASFAIAQSHQGERRFLRDPPLQNGEHVQHVEVRGVRRQGAHTASDKLENVKSRTTIGGHEAAIRADRFAQSLNVD